jgi:exopolyphosphatase/guanosine-5'-triphosphate,3'-diphosphate pyrophosphatase
MQSQIDRTVNQIVQHVPTEGTIELIALGGDVRFAASQLLPDRVDGIGRLPVDVLSDFTSRMLDLSPDELVQKYHLAFPDAETLGPALLVYLRLARASQLDHILITDTNLRDGLLNDMAVHGTTSDEFDNQIIRSAIDLGRKFDFDEPHAKHVADLSRILFRELKSEHQLEPRYEVILVAAALLHEIGMFVSSRSFHKHTMYLIVNSELFGLSEKDVLSVSLVSRYHRRASPKPTHQGYATLNREDRIAVTKMAALLRVADALDHSHSQRVHEMTCEIEENRLVIAIPDVEDLSLEQLALRQKGSLFEEIFGLSILLRTARTL